jgi:transcription elongation factor GreA
LVLARLFSFAKNQQLSRGSVEGDESIIKIKNFCRTSENGGSFNFMDKKFYLTKKGLEKLKKEYETLKKIRLAKLKGETPKILHSEDVSSEYLAFKEDMNFLENRLLELEYILKNFVLIKKPPKEKQNIVDLGATVTLEDSEGSINEFMIVGTLEANPSEGKISNESPVGKALLGKKVGDEIVITSPINVKYKIKKIRYEIS